jgi:hypothetical protein
VRVFLEASFGLESHDRRMLVSNNSVRIGQ